jgi:hypothetical protein
LYSVFQEAINFNINKTNNTLSHQIIERKKNPNKNKQTNKQTKRHITVEIKVLAWTDLQKVD